MRFATTGCGIRSLLAWFFFLATTHGFAQGVVGPSSTSDGPKGASLSRNAVTPEASERLMQLLRSRPELTAILKSYLAQQTRIEGSELEEKSITNQMLYSRIQTDPKFATDASQWLVALAAETSSALQSTPFATGSHQQESTNSLVVDPRPSEPPASSAIEGHQSNGSARNRAIAEQVSPVPPKPSTPLDNEQSGTAKSNVLDEKTAAIQPAAATSNTDETSASLRSLPKKLLVDQQAFWTLPLHLNVKDLGFILPATFGSALLVGSDTAIEGHLPTSPNTVKMAANASTAGMAALIGTGGGLFLVGQMTHDEHKRETGLLMGEAAIDAYAASTAIQYITQRERPFTGNGRGQFFAGGNSFPSNTAAVSWAAAAVLTHEYPGILTKIMAYGVAAGVSAGRVIGEKHWTSDAVLGSALGWYMGRQIYRARSAGPQIDASNWGAFEKGPDEEVRDPAYMGTTYMPLDSWIYPAFDRLSALGYVPTGPMALKPWARLQCARWVLEARAQMESPDDSSNPEANRIVTELQGEFAEELTELEGNVPNVGIQLESAYARYTQIGGRPLRDAWHFGQTLYNDFGRPYGEGANAVLGVSGRAEAGPLAFYVRGEYQHSAAIAEYTPLQAQAIGNADGLPADSVPTFRQVNTFRPIEAYVALNVHNWQVSFGKQNLSWGQASDGSLILSDNAEGMTMLRVARVVPYQLPGFLSWIGKFKNTFYVGALSGTRYYRGPYPTFQLYGNAFQTLNPQPYTWGDLVAVKISPNLEIDAALQVIWAGPTRPATEATWLHTFSQHGNFQPVDPGKRYGGFNISYRLPYLRDWVKVYADGLTNDEPNPIAYPASSAWNAGIYLPQLPTLRQLDLRLEGGYTNIPNYPGLGPVYSNNHYADGYRNDLQLMGSWIGRQGDGLAATSTYWFSGQDKVQFGYRRQWADPVLLRGGNLNDFSTSVNWLVKSQFQVSAMVQYERWNFPLLSVQPKSDVAGQLQIMYWPTHTKGTGQP
jgi:membrane-associated phospholipid phosphatase